MSKSDYKSVKKNAKKSKTIDRFTQTGAEIELKSKDNKKDKGK